MPYKITPKARAEEDKLDLPGKQPTHHRVKLPNGGGVIPKEGVEVATLDPHTVRQMLRGEIDIHELDAEGKPGRKLLTAAEEIEHKKEADAKKAAADADAAKKADVPAEHHEEQ